MRVKMPPNEKYLDGNVEVEPLSEASPWQSDTETCLRAYLIVQDDTNEIKLFVK